MDETDWQLDQLDKYGIPADTWVRVTQMNHITEVQYIEHVNTEAVIRKLNSSEYVVLSTGELKEFKAAAKNRAESSVSMRRTFKKLRRLINNNFTGGKSELFFTLTYADNMQDHRQLGHDFKTFWLRFKRRYPDAEVLRVSEPQGRGAWHLHCLVKNVGFIANSDLAEMWGHGFVKVNSIKGVDNIGAYLTAYLADIPLEDFKTSGVRGTFPVMEKELRDGTKKKFVKGARLTMYPSGMNYFAKSKGIKYPETVNMQYSEAQKKTSSAKLVYSKNAVIKNDDFTNHLRTEVYNSKRGTD